MSWTEERLNKLITDKIEENSHLEYKAAGALDRTNEKGKTEITKDVSAMANADGGTIIYGLSEHRQNKHLPGALDPIERKDYSKEWLEQIINSIEPRIVGIEIVPVTAGDPNRVYYVVEVPKSSTAHQARDQRYYRRYNFECQPMYDHEIRDVMNRQKTARVEVEIYVWLGKNRFNNHIYCKLRNLSEVMAQHAALTLIVPALIEDKYVSFEGGKLEKLDSGYSGWILKGRTPRILFPESTLSWTYPFSFASLSFTGEAPKSTTAIAFTAFADHMRPLKGEVELASCIGIQSPPPSRSDPSLPSLCQLASILKKL